MQYCIDSLGASRAKEKRIFFSNYLHFPVKYSIFALSINHRGLVGIRSSMDRISDSGSDDMGSIPVGSTPKKPASSRLLLSGEEPTNGRRRDRWHENSVFASFLHR